jgi:hypothetical protein
VTAAGERFRNKGEPAINGGRPTQRELRVFAEDHLLYEIEMLRGLTKELKRVLDYRDAGGDLDALYPLAVRNAMVESFAIRARLLVEFLYGSKVMTPRQDDTLAEHYVTGEWDLPDLPVGLKDVRKRVGKGVAHLTYHRLLDERKGWDYGQMWLELATIIRGFAGRASPALLPPEVAAKIIDLTEPIDAKDVLYAASVTGRLLVAGLHVSTASHPVVYPRNVPTTSIAELVEQVQRTEPSN